MIGLLSPDEYYETMQRGPILNQLYRIGQLFWAPSLFLFGDRQPHLLRSNYVEARRVYEYQVDQIRDREFQNPELPNPTLGIRSDERAMIVGAKHRPVIIVSRSGSGRAALTSSQDNCFLVAPVYSFGGDETKLTYSESFIERVKAYVYWQFFYLPAHPPARMRESFVRLDRVQAVHKSLLEHKPVRLSDDAQDLLRSWMSVYLGEELDATNNMLFDYREQAIASLT